MYYGAIEAGGTKMVCAIGNEQGEVIDRIQCPTRSPEDTMPVIREYFEKYSPCAIGIGTFGPVELHRENADYGSILKSPKEQWQGFNFYQYFKEAFDCKVIVDTDVNAAAYGEYKGGALKGVNTGMYLTVGTGIGAGVVVDGNLLHGMLHPEAGHILLSRHPDDSLECNCRFHENCFEGLAAGPALSKRAGMSGELIPEDHPVWDIECFYIAEALVNYTLVLSVERIVLGGGVMAQEHLFPRIREKYKEIMGGYMDTDELGDLDSYIVPAGLEGQQGIIGTLYMAMDERKL